jgi:hypothetical protein
MTAGAAGRLRSAEPADPLSPVDVREIDRRGDLHDCGAVGGIERYSVHGLLWRALDDIREALAGQRRPEIGGAVEGGPFGGEVVAEVKPHGLSPPRPVSKGQNGRAFHDV